MFKLKPQMNVPTTLQIKTFYIKPETTVPVTLAIETFTTKNKNKRSYNVGYPNV
jgi:hypothetical protein